MLDDRSSGQKKNEEKLLVMTAMMMMMALMMRNMINIFTMMMIVSMMVILQALSNHFGLAASEADVEQQVGFRLGNLTSFSQVAPNSDCGISSGFQICFRLRNQ